MLKLGLEGRVVIVTGGSKGIGLACAGAFLREGGRVAIVSRSRANLDAAVGLLGGPSANLAAISCDLTGRTAAAEMTAEVEERLGAPDVLVNSAGAAKRYLPEELNVEAWHAAMDAKYFTYIHALDAVLPGMAKRGKGAVVNIIGMGGKAATAIHLPGGAANSALMLATVGLASVYGPKGVRINGINPGATLTERLQEGLRVEARAKGLPESEVLAQRQARIPLRRLAAPEDIAALASSWPRTRQATSPGRSCPWTEDRTRSCKVGAALRGRPKAAGRALHGPSNKPDRPWPPEISPPEYSQEEPGRRRSTNE